MPQPSTTHSTFTIERTFPAPAERVFAAISNPTLKRRWFAEGEQFDLEEFEMDFRVGGVERTRFRTPPQSPLKGAPLTNTAIYEDIVPTRRVVLASTMSVGDHRISASLLTFELLAIDRQTTKLLFTDQSAFFEGADGPTLREQGWIVLLDRLVTEVSRP